MNEYKVINDPVFGFIKVPRGLLLNIVKHRLFQRLSRIKQLGMASVVYPGAQHTRFQHSLGAFHLMSEAILSLSQKGIFIFDSEAEALKAAILLHDVGHGPFSHVLEHTLIRDISHEEISIMMMEEINHEMNGALNLAIKIFKDDYSKRFLHQLISSQLDMDRLDYLRRDSFFTGVTEGNIGSARIIKMLNVVDDRLVVEQKGIYSIENYLTTRRLMYWQVYLHKTTVAYEKTLVNLLRRAKYLAHKGEEVFATPALRFFLYNDVDASRFESDPQALANYELLDDNDIWASVKTWMSHTDRVLSILAKDLADRRIFRVEVREEPFADNEVSTLQQQLADAFHVSFEDAAYLISVNTIQKDMYDPSDDQIDILFKGKNDDEGNDTNYVVKDIANASELFNISLLSKKIRKYYLCYQRI
ncbi:MAG: HD domain-containing protein [Bacteroidales bacterium]|nr:HD domain-containing protein [Bacteroidales bacterium]